MKSRALVAALPIAVLALCLAACGGSVSRADACRHLVAHLNTHSTGTDRSADVTAYNRSFSVLQSQCPNEARGAGFDLNDDQPKCTDFGQDRFTCSSLDDPDLPRLSAEDIQNEADSTMP